MVARRFGDLDLARNLITDVAGVRVGHADDAKLGSGSTVVLFDQPTIAAVDIRGGGPGTRESALLDPAMTVERIDAITLSGGSAFGLDAASGTQAWLRDIGTIAPQVATNDRGLSWLLGALERSAKAALK